MRSPSAQIHPLHRSRGWHIERVSRLYISSVLAAHKRPRHTRALVCMVGGRVVRPTAAPSPSFEGPTQPCPRNTRAHRECGCDHRTRRPAGVPPPSAGMASPQWLARRLQPQSQISNAIYDVFFKRSSAMMLTVMVTATTSGIIYDYAMNGIWDRVNKGVRRIIPEAVAAAGPCWRRS